MMNYKKTASMAVILFGAACSGLALAATEREAAVRAAEINAMPVEQQVILAKEMSDFSEAYFPHVAERDSRRSRRGVFTGNLKFAERSCIMGGVAGLGNIAPKDPKTGATTTPVGCDCPRGNTKLSCLIQANATVRFAPQDAGAMGYVLIYAADGKGDTAMLLNGKWTSIRDFKVGRYSYITDPIQGTHTYPIPYAGVMCGSGFMGAGTFGVAKRYTIYAGYGVADNMDLKYMALAEKNGIAIDQQDFLWQAARIDGYRTKNTQAIGSITCN